MSVALPHLQEIFAEALEKSAGPERTAFLDKACGQDLELRQQVDALLEADQAAGSFLPLPAGNGTTALLPPSEAVGSVLGPYTLVEKIGEGGFGVVYLAEQREPIRRRVALKVLKPGMDTRQVIARFEAERQALALMDHPNIAKVFDAGTTRQARRGEGERGRGGDHGVQAASQISPSSALPVSPSSSPGRPYFVMELVKGIAVTKYCNQCSLAIPARLGLFIDICHAVQHAHQKGVIHRDIKPSNVLVAIQDGVPTIKVIDFGVAKAINQRLTDQSLHTHFTQLVGTPLYMSPEQAEMSPLEVDTRGDIYSLGVLLYELLTGTAPFEQERLLNASFDEMRRIIREEEPPLPSTRLSRLSPEAASTVATQWRTEPRRLAQSLRGDLDWIVMKCLEKDRTRRYETASALAADIEHYLADEPVLAAAPSRIYRLRKFARRYRGLLSAAAALIAILVATAVFSSIQWLRASKAEHTATQHGQRAAASAAEARRNLYTAHMQQVQLEWDRSNLARVRELLAKYANPRRDQEDQRGWEWHYWTRMCEQDLRTLKGHEGAVRAVAFNSDGSLVVSAGQDGKVCVWNTGDGKLVREFKAHEGPATCVAFHGKTIATGGVDRILRLWDASQGREIASFQFGNIVSCLEFSHDGKLLAAGATSQSATFEAGQPVERRIIDMETRQELHRLDTGRDVYALRFTKDGSQLVIASTPNLEYWDTRTGKLLREIKIDQLGDNNFQYHPTFALALSATGDFIVTANLDQFVHLRSFSDAATATTFRGHAGEVRSVALSPDDEVIASAGNDNTIILWNTDTGEEIRRLRGHEQQITHVRFSPDGLRIASASADGAIKIWDAVETTDFRPFLTASKAHHATSAFSPDGALFAVNHFGGPPAAARNTFLQVVQVRDALSGRRAYELSGHHGWAGSIAFSHDGTKLATGSHDWTVKIHDTASQRELRTLEGFTWPITSLAFSPNDRWLNVETAEFDGRKGYSREEQPWFSAPAYRQRATDIGVIRQQLWDVGAAARIISFPATSLAFHPREEICAVARAEKDKYAIEFYRTDRPLVGQTPFRSWTLDAPASRMRYDPSGKRLAATLGSRLVVWNAEDPARVTSIPDAGDFLGFDESGERLFSHPTGQKTVGLANRNRRPDVRDNTLQRGG
jgi:WD40 repeat protein/serine/threonine protein kinase